MEDQKIENELAFQNLWRNDFRIYGSNEQKTSILMEYLEWSTVFTTNNLERTERAEATEEEERSEYRTSTNEKQKKSNNLVGLWEAEEQRTLVECNVEKRWWSNTKQRRWRVLYIELWRESSWRAAKGLEAPYHTHTHTHKIQKSSRFLFLLHLSWFPSYL